MMGKVSREKDSITRVDGAYLVRKPHLVRIFLVLGVILGLIILVAEYEAVNGFSYS